MNQEKEGSQRRERERGKGGDGRYLRVPLKSSGLRVKKKGKKMLRSARDVKERERRTARRTESRVVIVVANDLQEATLAAFPPHRLMKVSHYEKNEGKEGR